MRVLVLSDLWPPFPGGAERLIFNLARDLHRRRSLFEVSAVTGYEAARQFDGPPVVHYPIGTGELRDAGAPLIRSIITATDPEAILTHHYYASQFEQELDGCGVPYVQVVLNGRRLPGAAFAVYITEWVAAQVGDVGVDDFVLTPPAFDDVIADSHGDAIGFVKPIEHKGVETLYAIAEQMPDRQFVVLRGEWQDLEDIRPRDNITFVEPVVDMRDFYRQVRLLLVPSRSEDAGTVAQEATLNGLPCVSSGVDGLVETNGGGILLDPYDLTGWVETISALDEPGLYAATVACQRAHLQALDHPALLDRFARQMAAL